MTRWFSIFALLKNSLALRPSGPHGCDNIGDLLELWGGADEHNTVEKECEFNTVGNSRQDKLKHLHLFALEDSGSNLLEVMIKLNFAGQVGVNSSVWKHTHPDYILNQFPYNVNDSCSCGNALDLEQLDPTQSLIIVMRRNPISQFLAWNLNANKHWRPISRCSAPKSQWFHACTPEGSWVDKTHGCCQLNSTQAQFADLMDLWNSYHLGYQRLQKKALETSIPMLMMSFEDLVMEPDKVMLHVAQSINVPPLSKYDVPQESAQPGLSEQNARQHAVDNIRDKLYLNDITLDSVKQICHGVDESLMHGYDDC